MRRNQEYQNDTNTIPHTPGNQIPPSWTRTTILLPAHPDQPLLFRLRTTSGPKRYTARWRRTGVRCRRWTSGWNGQRIRVGVGTRTRPGARSTRRVPWRKFDDVHTVVTAGKLNVVILSTVRVNDVQVPRCESGSIGRSGGSGTISRFAQLRMRFSSE